MVLVGSLNSRHFSVSGWNFNLVFRYSDSAKVRFLSSNETQPKQHFRLEGSWGTVFKSRSKNGNSLCFKSDLRCICQFLRISLVEIHTNPLASGCNKQALLILDHGFPDQFFGSISRPLGFPPRWRSRAQTRSAVVALRSWRGLQWRRLRRHSGCGFWALWRLPWRRRNRRVPWQPKKKRLCLFPHPLLVAGQIIADL